MDFIASETARVTADHTIFLESSMKIKILFLNFIILLIATVGHAQPSSSLISNNIHPRYNSELSGSYPSIKGDKFKEVNNSILKFITGNFDKKGEVYPTEISFNKLFENKYILSFSLDYNISNATERYFNKYYTLSLIDKKELSLAEYLEANNISKYDVLNSINNVIGLCLSSRKSLPDYCSDMKLQSLIENNTKVDYSDISGFFIKKNSIGIGIDSNKFTTTFIYNIKTKKTFIK